MRATYITGDRVGGPDGDRVVVRDGRAATNVQRTQRRHRPCVSCARVSQKPHSGAITCLAVDGTGKILLTGATDHTVRSWDIRSGDALKVFEGHKSSVVCMTVCRVDSSLQRWTWVGSIHELGWVAFFSTYDGLGWVGLNDIVAEYCKTHTFYCPYFSHFFAS